MKFITKLRDKDGRIKFWLNWLLIFTLAPLCVFVFGYLAMSIGMAFMWFSTPIRILILVATVWGFVSLLFTMQAREL